MNLQILVLLLGTFGQAELIKLASNPTLSPDGKTLAFSWRGDIWSAPSTGGIARQLTLSPANDRMPAYSPDGKRLAFVSDREGSAQLFVMPATGGPARQTTFHTAGFTLDGWFPDGVHLLANGLRDHYWAHPERLLQINADTRLAEKPIFDDYAREGSVSPDGKQVLFTREGPSWWRKGYHGSQAAQIWLYSVESKKFERLLDHPNGCRSAVWRSDGSGFYYCGAQGGCFNIREYTIATKADRQVTDFKDESCVMPCISKDGSTLVFRRLFDLYRIEPGKNETPTKIELTASIDIERNKVERRLLQTASQVTFTKDGLQVAFTSGGDLWVMDTELKEPKQITNTPEEERDPVFSPDGNSLAFISDRDGKTDMYVAHRGDANLYWWQNESFNVDRLTNDEIVEENPSYSPDGKTLAVVKGLGDLWLMNADGKNAHRILESWNTPRIDWSPDGKWIAYAYSDNDFNRDIWIKPVDGSRSPFNLSRNPDNDDAPIWSPDGRMIAFVGSRYHKETDIFYVFLRKEDEDRSDRERTIEKALEKMRKGPTSAPAAKAAGAAPQTPPGAAPAAKQGGPGRRRRPGPEDLVQQEPAGTAKKAADGDAKAKAAPTNKPALPITVKIDFDRIEERIHKISIPNSFETNLAWSPDSKKLAFAATVGGNRGTYTVEIPGNLKPTLVSASTIAQGRWIEPANQLIGLIAAAGPADGDPANPPASTSFDDSPFANATEQIGLEGNQVAGRGTPGALSMSGGSLSAYAVRCYQTQDTAKKARAIFDACWRTMRDIWYDANLNHRDWNGVRDKYSPVAEQCGDSESTMTLVQMMLGELNGSHLGFMPIGGTGPAGGRQPGWNVVTPHLGIRFDPTFTGPGLKIRDVIADGPADKANLKLQPGEIVAEINGVKVDPTVDLTTILNGPSDRDVKLRVADSAGKRRTVTIRPTSYPAVTRLLYESWIRNTRKKVDELSGGTLGYLHVRAMATAEFQRFEDELYSVGVGKKGLLIDVRENGGGSTADHMLTALCQPRHAITVPRGGGQGYPQDRIVYSVWNKPIVVLCNQNSFSNAEIFSHAIKALGRGKLVGVPTAGGVISTGAKTIMETGRLRIPFRGWFGIKDGEDMELHGAVPEYVVWPNPGEIPAGKDAQIDKAVMVLLADVKEWENQPPAKLIKASERK